MSESISRTSILAPLDTAHLMGQGLVGAVNADGTRRIHKRRLNRFGDLEYGHLPLDASVSQASDMFVSIPDQLISQATIEYVGFSKTKANEIWSTWNNWPSIGPGRETDPDDSGLQVTFLDFICGYISSSLDTYSDDDDEWINCVNAYGLSMELQNSILDPLFKYLRLSDSCAEWSRDTIQMRYAGLKAIQEESSNREIALHNAGYRFAMGGAVLEPPPV
ncbi:hypothetical protein CEP54_002442 [Fusarium duplospermum]|uniref:Uncharacterized protein n=1 Tax=Fusarium duplospermum TaxID=1325734 RepID=A0A428QV47_9HYPO|nr:hypothetical protein CEP54_002442 [Fusarium duplospermum]